ncbi:MAG TPA: acyl-CoA dehydrogenase [Xanthomonadales bacterium]|nr:acyl-CoA dehydrogenase [Xanthomonadales bacterium]
MSDYVPPLDTISSQLNHAARTHGVFELEAFTEFSGDVAEAVLDEAARFAQKVLAPINQLGDQQGAKCSDGRVTVPVEFVDAYRQFIANGWTSLGSDPEYGGQGFPELLVTAVYEMFSAANLAFTLCPKLAQSAVQSLQTHASAEIRQRYLEDLVSGRYTSSMDLTEPSAGSDLGRITTTAVSQGDHYLVRGRKIFITWGDHDMAENVIHLVLARTPGAAQGSRGLSLFLVPKFLDDAEGNATQRNDMQVLSIEHKLGIHCSPTCVMSYGDQGGATGYLIGAEGDGLTNMFTMMNQMRLGVGVQGVALAQRAYQDSVDYARERVQGHIPGRGEVKIIAHGDMRRMLLTMHALTLAARALVLETAAAIDVHAHSDDAVVKKKYGLYADLLTPVAKGWCTEVAQEAAYLSVQVFGGMGFVEETGVAQYMRDARILPIYEGTNGIQALDLVDRKLLKKGDSAMRTVIAEARQLCSELPADFAREAKRLGAGIGQLETSTDWILAHSADDPNTVSAVAFNYLMLTGTVLGGWLTMRHAAAALEAGEHGAEAYAATVRFYLEQIMPRADAYAAAVSSGGSSIIDFPEAMF